MGAGKIVSVQTSLVGGDRWGWVIVQIETDEGIVGVGEGSLEGRELSVAATVGELARYLIGEPADRIEKHYFSLFRDAVWTGGAVLQTALSSVEMALWDIKGKYLGAPVYQLLGGKFRDRIELYANGWWYQGGTPEQVGQAAKEVVARGYRGLKFNPFVRQRGVDAHRLAPHILARGVDYVGAVRDAVGPNVEIFLDFNAVFNNTGAAIAATRELEQFGIGFVEEPIPQENMEEMALFRRKVNVPVATGERLCSPFAFNELLSQQAADVVQPDLCHCGGILAAYKISTLAEMHYVPIAPHNPNGPVAQSATAQLALCVPNFYLLEHFPHELWRDEVVSTSCSVSEGWMTVSDKPGLGVDVHQERFADHPFVPKDLVGFHEPTYIHE